jgi:hypothetical protein
MAVTFTDESGVERLLGELTGTVSTTDANHLGFYGAPPVAKPAIGAASAAAIIAALVSLGLVTDDT